MSQTDRILTHIKKRPITPMQALNLYGCMRLAARITDLKDRGHKIVTEMVTKGNTRYARYYLLADQKQKTRRSGSSA